jgi:uncharacterized membrane protein SpoIIM required for sporulation
MSPLKFEADYRPNWDALDALLLRFEGATAPIPKDKTTDSVKNPKSQPLAKVKLPAPDAAHMAALYRRCCEHLALAQARGYPIHLTQRLEALTQRAHRVIYRQQDYGLARLGRLILVDFPQSVRAHRWYLLVSALLFVLPMVLVGWASYRDPGFVLHLIDADQVKQFDGMYRTGTESIGRTRSADTDWHMFGYYIMHNIGIGFQCFAAGIFAGVGSVFYLVFNGLFSGAVAGYLVASGYAENFFSFVVTHAAFELTAIVLSGAAGLRLGHAVLAPGTCTRVQALKRAASDAVVVVYGVFGMLVVAAAVEAFWSSATWVIPAVKYSAGAVCWTLVLAYLTWQGRPRAS